MAVGSRRTYRILLRYVLLLHVSCSHTKYLDIVATSSIVQTVVDMSYAIRDLIHEGYPVTRADVATLSPYITRTIKRFGDYVVNLDVIPTPLVGAMELPLDDIQGDGEAEQPA